LSSRWEKSGRGGTEDETVKLLDGIQRVQVPPTEGDPATVVVISGNGEGD
jgi:hypothetical protein